MVIGIPQPLCAPASAVSLYFHIPFCRRKCPYCHFYVLPNKEELKTQLVESLALEWKKQLPLLLDKEVVSIYFGGGTPTLLSPVALGQILTWIQNSLKLSANCEITLEANPEDGEILASFASLGINRFSLGAQALHSPTLLQLGRNHTHNQVKESLEIAHRSGVHNLSIDLMYDAPQQSLASFEATLKELKQLPLTHLSLYNLTIEPHTRFFKEREKLRPLLPTPEESLKLLQMAVHACQEIGLKRYEISAFAKTGYHSVHNVGYWTARPFLGFGPSAFSYWEGRRFQNVPNLQRYHALLLHGESPLHFSEQLSYPHNLLELLAIELRLMRGVSLTDFQKRHGALPPPIFDTFSTLCQTGWLIQESDQIRLSDEGVLFYDSLAAEII